jgi:hypothetical protein
MTFGSGAFRQRCNKAALEFMQEMCSEKGRDTYFSFVISVHEKSI